MRSLNILSKQNIESDSSRAVDSQLTSKTSIYLAKMRVFWGVPNPRAVTLIFAILTASKASRSFLIRGSTTRKIIREKPRVRAVISWGWPCSSSPLKELACKRKEVVPMDASPTAETFKSFFFLNIICLFVCLLGQVFPL